ncbi:MAG: gamma carbonic anhydrase family protein [Pseudomonadota bacterium]
MILKFNGKIPQIDDSSFVAPNATIIGDTIISENVSIYFGAVCRGDFNHIFIGPGSCIQENVVLNPMPNEPIIIKEEVIIGYASIIHGGTIENNCLIGMGSRILYDVVVGAESIIAAGSMLIAGTRVPPRSLFAGAPGKVVRKLEDSEFEMIKIGLDYYGKMRTEYKKNIV